MESSAARRTSRPTLIVFDLGGVLVGNVGFDRLAHWSKHGVDLATLRARWLASPAVRDFERGATTIEVFADRFVRVADRRDRGRVPG